MADERVEMIDFGHPNGCPAQGTVNAQGTLVPLEVIVTLAVPTDRDGWTGAACGACGGQLVEVGG